MKDLFVPLPASPDDAAVVAAAIGLAHGYRARALLWMPPPSLGIAPSFGSASASVLAGVVERVELDAAARAGALREELQAAGVDGEVCVEAVRLVDPVDAMARRACRADLALVVRPRTPSDFGAAHDLFCTLLFESGRPVLVLPPDRPAPRRIRRLLLAWKPAREAARACHDALATLQPDAVEVLVVDPEDAEAGTNIAAHLARHGTQVEVTTVPGAGEVAHQVLRKAQDVDADAIVVGGYGHARLREWALGGTTRALFAALDRPVLFSH